MESKESMGLPSPGPAGVTGSLNGPHQRNGEGSLPGGPSTPTPHSSPHSAPIPVAPIASRPQGPISDAAKAIAAPIVTSVSSTQPPPHLNAPPSYTPDMSCAIVPHSAGVLNSGNHSAGFNLTSGAISFGGGSEQPVKKKRGRPRKYGPHGSIALSVTPLSSIPSPMSPSSRRGRGRPPGSGKNQQLAALGELMLGSAGAGFTPHAITVAAGEDVAARIMSFSQQGPRGICILSANGAISNVTLRQPAISGGTVTYEGRFEILSLSGSFLLTESGGTRSRTGGLSVSLAGPDGRVVGGGVAGMLIAASPVQVVVGSFTYNSSRIQPRPSNIGVHTGFSKLFPLSNPNIGNSAPELSMTDVADVKPTVSESPPFNQSTGAAASSNADSPRGQEDD